MNTRHSLFVLLGLTVLFAAGCAPSPEKKLIGSWQGKFVMDDNALQQEANNPVAAAFAAGMEETIKNLAASMSVDYEFLPDKTFTASTPVGDSKGSWQVISAEGDVLKVRLHPENISAQEITITFTGPDQFETKADKGKLVFTKQPD